jgi:hypothetical protein
VAYLISPEKWRAQREEFCRLIDIPAEAATALERKQTELDGALGEFNAVLADGASPVRLDEDGNLVIPQLSAEDIPTEADELKDELTALVPFAPIASVFIELDRRTGFLDCFTHAGGATPRSPELKRNLIAVLIALSTNLGIARTADACGIGYDTLAWTQEWYVREETLRGESRVDRLPPAAAAHRGVRVGHPVVLGRAAVPHQGQIDHRQSPEQVFRR